MEIDEKVREAHLSHFCPGGAGFPVTTSRPIGLDLEEAAPPPALDGAPVGGDGHECGRCGRRIGAGQDTRRRVSGAWVHETCPA